jgi:carbamate kinase
MTVVVALGGNVLLRCDQSLTAAHQLENIRIAAQQIARLARTQSMVLMHGNGPQVGMLELQGHAYTQLNGEVQNYSLDVLGAQTEGMIGYLLEQELANLLPAGRALATVLTRVEVDRHDDAFNHPTKPVGPMLTAAQATELERTRGWSCAPDGNGLRRVVPSPRPLRILSMPAIRVLVEQGVLVIAAGGGGIPVALSPGAGQRPANFSDLQVDDPHGASLQGVEAVIDKDWCAALLARELGADDLIIATDVDAVYLNWGTPKQCALGRVSTHYLAQYAFASGSMAPKVLAACDFVNRTGKQCHIGALAQLEALVGGHCGTTVVAEPDEL